MILLAIAIILSFDGVAAPCLAVDGEWITAGDLSTRVLRYAEFDPGLRVVRAPFPGTRRVLGPASLLSSGSESAAGTDPFCVERRLRTLSRETVSEALEQSLTVSDESRISFELVDYDRSMLPSGRLEFLVQTLPPPIPGLADEPVLWRGRLFYAEGRSVPVWVRVRLWIESEVCLLVRDVARGEALKPEDCRIGKRRYPPFMPPPLREASALEGTVAARRLKADESVYQALLVRKPDVEAGKLVELKVVNGGTRLRFQAKAASSGRLGDSVTVTNLSNGKRIEGQVVGPNSVEVHLK